MSTKSLHGILGDLRWIDHLEGELEPNLAKDMDRLLSNSPGDRKRWERLWQTRKLVKESDDVALPEDGRYYDGLHDRIMKALDEEPPSEEPKEREEIEENEVTKMSWTLALLTIARRLAPKELMRS